MNENFATQVDCCLDPAAARQEILLDVLPGHVHHIDHFVFEVTGEARVQPRYDLQYMRDTLYNKEEYDFCVKPTFYFSMYWLAAARMSPM